ncbi:conserved protein of unknown function (plasmid) [Rhodovastum atsumiense]|nr:conserved protein of unknown function [Rhodovastum atsumiense]
MIARLCSDASTCWRHLRMNALRPQPFLEVRVEDTVGLPTLLGLCAGYELGQWRSRQFAKYLIRNLIEFIYPIEEWDAANSATGVEMTARAAEAVYKTTKYENRGEIGELILFSILRSYYGSLPVVSKFYFKSAVNDTVKGFDAVHFIKGKDGLELWLGEVKFYTDAAAAIRDVIEELHKHLEADYLRGEFTWIGNKMRGDGPHYHEIRRLFDDKTSLDQVFPVLHIPVLITYESKAIGTHDIVNDVYRAAIEAELRHHFESFKGRCAIQRAAVHLILVPLGSKRALQEDFDSRLRAAQDL